MSINANKYLYSGLQSIYYLISLNNKISIHFISLDIYHSSAENLKRAIWHTGNF